MPLPPEKADRLTRFAWLGAAGALALSVAALLIPRPDVRVDFTPVSAPGGPTGDTPSVGTDEESRTIVWTDLSAVMNQIHAIDQPVTEEQPQPTEGPIAEKPVDPEPQTGENAPRGLPGWRYVGALETGGAITAVVMVETKQHFASAGTRIAGYQITDVTNDYVLVSTDSGERRVDREASPQASLQGTSRGAINMPGRRPGDPAEGETPEQRLERLRGGGR